MYHRRHIAPGQPALSNFSSGWGSLLKVMYGVLGFRAFVSRSLFTAHSTSGPEPLHSAVVVVVMVVNAKAVVIAPSNGVSRVLAIAVVVVDLKCGTGTD